MHLLVLVGDQTVHAVEGNAAVIADDAAAAVGVGQAGDDAGLARAAHFRRIYIEHAVVVRLPDVAEDILRLSLNGFAVVRGGLDGHVDAAIGHESPLERRVGLQADDLLQILVDVAGLVGGDGRDGLAVHIQHAALVTLFPVQAQHFGPQGLGAACRGGQELRAACVGRVVALNEIAYIDLARVGSGLEGIPLFVVHMTTLRFRAPTRSVSPAHLP